MGVAADTPAAALIPFWHPGGLFSSYYSGGNALVNPGGCVSISAIPAKNRPLNFICFCGYNDCPGRPPA